VQLSSKVGAYSRRSGSHPETGFEEINGQHLLSNRVGEFCGLGPASLTVCYGPCFAMFSYFCRAS
jgi:hypothetical protein